MDAKPADSGAIREQPRRRRRSAVEVPTMLLIMFTYGGWIVLTSQYHRWPLWIVAPAVIILLILHSSLQHEIIHGHPTRSRGINRLLGMVPLSLWLPFDLYRRNHLVHHVDERLTDPIDDPESNYWTPEQWATLSPPLRALFAVQQTLAGRIVVGSFWRIGGYLRSQLNAIIADEKRVRIIWMEHLLWCLPLMVWLSFVCRMPLWVYVLSMVIPANGILLIRPFAEHRAHAEAGQRTAIVERAWILGPLFLNNNLHALHHESPGLPWYEYKARYRLERRRLITHNGALVYSSYVDVARRFMFTSYDALLHPTSRVPRTGLSNSQSAAS
jgi:fatty acid desaturase